MNYKLLPALRTFKEFWHFLWHRFFAANCIQNAAALAYTSLLSMVPLMVVSFSVLTAFPVFDSISSQIQDFIFENFVPNSGKVVQAYIESFASKAKQLTGTGIMFLMVTAVMMMSTIEKAFNAIWRLNQKRNLLGKFIVYWSVLTLGPLLMGVGMAVTSYVVSMPFFSEPAVLISKKFGLLKAVPFCMEAIAFALLYLLVPYTRVPLLHAAAGGVLAASLFELAKLGFTLYITRFPTYQTIYGALATIPILLIWVYLSWTIALIGAQFSHSLRAFRFRHHQPSEGVSHELMTVLRILRHLWEVQESGQALSVEQLAELEPQYGLNAIQTILDTLEEHDIVIQNEQGHWLLTRDLSRFTVSDLYRRHPFLVPLKSLGGNPEITNNETITGVFDQLEQSLGQSLDIPFSTMFENNGHVRE